MRAIDQSLVDGVGREIASCPPGRVEAEACLHRAAAPRRRLRADVARACVYLAAPSGKFITGPVLTLGGGHVWGELWFLGEPDYLKVED